MVVQRRSKNLLPGWTIKAPPCRIYPWALPPPRQEATRYAPRREPIPKRILGLTYLLILTRFIWPLHLPLSVKIVAAGSHLSRCSFTDGASFRRLGVLSGVSTSVVALFNWTFGMIVLLPLLQLLLDVGLLFHGRIARPTASATAWLHWLPSPLRSVYSDADYRLCLRRGWVGRNGFTLR
jgi:hypothetical protein